MESKIYTFALLKSFYDSNEDILDAFLPLVVRGISTKKFVGTEDIQKQVNQDIHMEIPLHVLKTLAIRAKKKEYVEQKENTSTFKRIDTGTTYVESLEKERDVERRINGFFESFRNFAAEKELTLDHEQSKSVVLTFLNENISDLVEFLSPNEEDVDLQEDQLTKLENRVFTRYLLHIQANDQENYNIIKELIQGSIIASTLAAKYSDRIVFAQDKKFAKNTEVYLDTNVVFSLLGLHTPEKNTAANELLDLLKNTGFTVKVFDFTLDEAARYITSYLQNEGRYSSALNVDAIYSTLKQKKWGRSDVLSFVSDIESEIEKLGIDIDYQFTVNLNKYEDGENDLRGSISKYKKNQPLSSANHDIAVIEKVRELRKRSVRRIEDAKVFFLTSDHALQRFDYIELGHKDSGTFSEVILDRVLASILWLKDTSIELPISTVIASHSRDLLINRKVWERFYSVLQRLHSEGKTTKDSIATLFYHNYIEDALKDIDETSVDDIDEQLVLEKIEEASKILTEEKGSLEKEVIELADDLVGEQSERQQDLEKFSSQISNIRSNIKNKARRSTEKYFQVIRWTTTTILWILGGVVYFFLPEGWDEVWDLFIGGGILFGVPYGVSRILKYFEIRNRIMERVHNKLTKDLLESETNEDPQKE